MVAPGETFDAGVPVRAVGEQHAVIHPEFPRFFNSGYVLSLGDQMVYHPGDALTDPGERIDLLCAPVSAPWLKISEALDFVRLVGAPRNLGIHDRVYSEFAHGIVDGQMGRFLGDAAGVRPDPRRHRPLTRQARPSSAYVLADPAASAARPTSRASGNSWLDRSRPRSPRCSAESAEANGPVVVQPRHRHAGRAEPGDLSPERVA